MRQLLHLVCIGLFILFGPYADAQTITDIGGMMFSTYGKNQLSNLPVGSPLNNNEFALRSFEIWAPLPRIKVNHVSVYTNFYYRNISFQYDRPTTGDYYHTDRVKEVKSIILLKFPIGRRWFFNGIFIPALASDFKDPLSSDDFQFDGILGIGRKFGENKNFRLAIGPHILYSFGTYLFTPSLTIDYKSNNDKWIAQFYWPRLNVNYILNKNTRLGIVGKVDLLAFNLSKFKDDLTQKTVHHASFSSYEAGVQFSKRLVDKFWISLQTGVSFSTSYTLYAENSSGDFAFVAPKDDTVRTFQLNPKMYGKLMISYKIK